MHCRAHRLPLALALVPVFACVLLPAASPLGAAEPDPTAPTRPYVEPLPPPAAPDGVAPADEPSPRAATGPLWPWAKMVYQSAQYSDNWEIVISNDDGSAPIRLTYHPASDVQPDLSRGGQQIVFASNRDGLDLELYVMNADGSGLRQLTFNNKDDARPVWSPDGRRIAFQSYRWGRAEVLVINADGSGEQRLTVHDSYDGDPTWSPDGTQIAFCSYSDDEVPAIFVMPSAGGPATRISTIESSCDPVWSPDGSRIAFDASPGPSTFFDPWVMNADGSAPRLVYDSSVDVWTHSWSPDGRYIAFSGLNYVEWHGDLYLTATYASAVPVDEPFWEITTLVHSDRVMWPSLATLDTTAPMPAFAPLPAFARTSGYGLAWAATDSGGSGVATYDIETRTATTSWARLLTGTAATSQARTGAPGLVEYRIRARDQAFNTSAWPAGASVATRLFAATLSGRITDNRGVGLPDITPTIAPWTVTNEATGNGDYLARLSALGNHSLKLDRAGYAWVPPTTRAISADATQTYYLPPANNAIRNANFESVAGGLDQWTVGGALPVTVTSDAVSTGDRAVSLGRSCAQSCLAEVGTLQDEYEGAQIAVDSRGGLHLTYRSDQGGRYRFRPAGGVWSTPTPILDGLTPLILTIDAADTLHAIISSGDIAVCYSRKPIGSAWSPCEEAPLVQGGHGLLVDGHGVLHVLANYDYIQRSADGVWRLIPLPKDTHLLHFALGSDGNVHFVMKISSDDGIAIPERIVHRVIFPGGVWGPETVIYRAADYYESTPTVVGLAADTFGRLFVLARSYSYPYDLLYAYRQPDGQWTPFSLIAANVGEENSVAIDNRGMIHLIFNFPGRTVYTHAMPGQPWSTPITLGDNYAALPLLVVGPDDSLFGVVPEIIDYHFVLKQLASAPAGQAGVATLSQQVAIPATMSHPTLSFMKRVLGNGDGGATVVARLQEGGNPPQSFPIAGDARWSLGWLDLSAWAGKTVTVTFAVEQPADAPPAQLFLDAVTLGSASPQLWAQVRSPVQAQPGATATGVLAFGNRGAADAADAALTLTLPDGLSLVAATPPAEVTGNTARWSLGALAAGEERSIALTLAVASGAPLGQRRTLRAELTSATPEVELADNRSEQAVFFGWQSFMPGLFKN